MDELRKLPPVTLTFISSVFLITTPILLRLVSIYPLVFVPSRIFGKLELWRLVTPFLFGGKGIGAIFDAFLLGRNSMELETGHFGGRTADYVWALMLTAGGIIAMNVPLQTPILYRALLVGLTHIWAQASPTSKISLFGLITLPAPYFPFALTALDLVQGGPTAALSSASGIAAGHAYWFLKEIYPRHNASRQLGFLSTPNWLVNLVGNGLPPTSGAGAGVTPPSRWAYTGGNRLGGTAGRGGGGVQASAQTPVAPAGNERPQQGAGAGVTHRWGTGNRLGEQ